VRPNTRKGLRDCDLVNKPTHGPRKYMILLILQVWLAALDDLRNWLIREAA